MPRRFTDSPYAALVPLAFVVLLAGLYAAGVPRAPRGCASTLIARAGGRHVDTKMVHTVCRAAPYIGLVRPDMTVKVDPTGAIQPPVVVASSWKTAAVAKAREETEAARLRMLNSATRRNAAHLAWTFFIAVGVLASLVGFAATALVLTRSEGEAGCSYRVRLAAALVPSILLGVVMYFTRLEMPLMEAMLWRTIGSGAPLGEPGVVELTSRADGLLLAAALALVLGCTLMLWTPGPVDPASASPASPLGGGALPAAAEEREMQRRLRPITHRLRNLRIVLYAATLLLVTGTLRMQVSMEWVLSFLNPQDAEVVAGLTSTVVSIQGAFYSVMLAGIYLPSVYILRARAGGLIADAHVPEEAKKQARESSAPGISATTLLPRLAALMGPLLAGPFAAFLQKLVG
jgi:hypothetical protein